MLLQMLCIDFLLADKTSAGDIATYLLCTYGPRQESRRRVASRLKVKKTSKGAPPRVATGMYNAAGEQLAGAAVPRSRPGKGFHFTSLNAPRFNEAQP
ncbi:hypothetical protein F4861DRAFT_516318 [Xylaria intraflava]|nr:hypothetical protein F4861DRAFT_516318 [Xylaria intraflava]